MDGSQLIRGVDIVSVRVVPVGVTPDVCSGLFDDDRGPSPTVWTQLTRPH